VTGDLYIYTELKQEIGIKKDSDDQDTEGFKQMERVPEDVGMRIFEPPFYEGPNGIVNSKPQA
jgi:hypothetical protein